MMKHIICTLIFYTLISGCSKYIQDLTLTDCNQIGPYNESYSKARELQFAMQEIVVAGVPGISMATYSELEGWWMSASGFAKIEDQTPMKVCHLQYLQSVAKTYMAVAVLKLYESGQVVLDHSIDRYLPQTISQSISESERITVRMLLNHTSGIPEYNFDPNYVSILLQKQVYSFLPQEYIEYIKNKPLNFEPGTKYAHTNTNYVLLALLVDEITGDHAQYIAKNIFQPLGLKNTYYRNDSQYLTYPTLVNSYWDRYSNGFVENVSQMQRNNVETLVGDDGIVSTPIEVVKFMRGLMTGELLKEETLQQMQTWVNDSDGLPRYGLGLGYSHIEGAISIGHSGGGIGAGCELRYFPEKDLYIFIAINLGTVTGSPIHDQLEIARNSLYRVLLY